MKVFLPLSTPKHHECSEKGESFHPTLSNSSKASLNSSLCSSEMERSLAAAFMLLVLIAVGDDAMRGVSQGPKPPRPESPPPVASCSPSHHGALLLFKAALTKSSDFSFCSMRRQQRLIIRERGQRHLAQRHKRIWIPAAMTFCVFLVLQRHWRTKWNGTTCSILLYE